MQNRLAASRLQLGRRRLLIHHFVGINIGFRDAGASSLGRRAIFFCFHQGNQRHVALQCFGAPDAGDPRPLRRPLTRGEEPSRAAPTGCGLGPRGERRGPQDCSLPE